MQGVAFLHALPRRGLEGPEDLAVLASDATFHASVFQILYILSISLQIFPKFLPFFPFCLPGIFCCMTLMVHGTRSYRHVGAQLRGMAVVQERVARVG